MADASRLLRRGMFPKELPPSFTTESFAIAVRGAAPPFQRGKWTHLCRHSLGHRNGLRRVLGIPNPTSQYWLADAIAVHWSKIRSFLGRSSALSVPTLRPRNRRAAGPTTHSDKLPMVRAAQRRKGGFLLVADVSEFYRSVYSHSIPWAVHGKANIKHNLSLPHSARSVYWADALDEALRPTVYGQTNGIPIGPDTSFIIGEILLCAVDRNLDAGSFIRFYDDYEFVTATRAEADHVLLQLQNSLASLDLELNSRKTSIVELPAVMSQGSEWVRKALSPKLSFDELIMFFDRIFESGRSFRNSPITSFALSLVGERQWVKSQWPLLQQLMGQAVSVDPGAVHQYVRALVRLYVEQQLVPDPTLLSELLDALVSRHAPLGHSSEVAWSLWAAMAFDARLSAHATRVTATMDDDVVSLLALEANTRGVFEGSLDTTLWASHMCRSELYGEHWLLAYEGLRRNLLPSNSGDFIGADPAFAWLRSNDVRFMKQFRKPSKQTLANVAADDDYSDDEDDSWLFDL